MWFVIIGLLLVIGFLAVVLDRVKPKRDKFDDILDEQKRNNDRHF